MVNKLQAIELMELYLAEHQLSWYDLLRMFDYTYTKSISPAFQIYRKFPDNTITMEDVKDLIELRGDPTTDNGWEICKAARDIFDHPEDCPLTMYPSDDDLRFIAKQNPDNDFIYEAETMHRNKTMSDARIIAKWLIGME